MKHPRHGEHQPDQSRSTPNHPPPPTSEAPADPWWDTPLADVSPWREQAPAWIREVARNLNFWEAPDPPDDLVERTVLRAFSPHSTPTHPPLGPQPGSQPYS